MTARKVVSTAPATVVPNFFIVGAARSGTTSLYAWLKQHPDIFLPENKEPSYFVNGYGVSQWDRYLGLFAAGRHKTAVGEASTPYMSAPESPRWIHDTLPTARIIILLRNPVERAFSLYGWMTMEGYEWVPTFELALEAEERRFNDLAFRTQNPQYFWNYMYVRSGFYCDQVRDYFELFGRERVRVYLFEDLVASPATVYGEVCALLGVSADHCPTFVPHNAAIRPRWIHAQRHLRQAWRRCAGLRPRLRRWPLVVLGTAMRLNRRWGTRTTLSAVTRKQLVNRYRHGVMDLSELLGRDLESWLA